MTTRDMTVQEHSDMALTFLGQSEQEFDAGDILQGCEKLWGAASYALMSVATLRGWPTRSHRNLLEAANLLSRERDDERLLMAFAVARKFQSNFYGHNRFDPFAETNAMDQERDIVAGFVRRTLDIAGE